MLSHINVDTMREKLRDKDTNMRTYLKLMEWARSCDVTKNSEFQKKYKGFYRVRRNNDWSRPYFEFMESHKVTGSIFEDVLNHVFDTTGKVEGSFSSKLLATINPHKPIWDKLVLDQLSIRKPVQGQKNKQKQIKESLATYSKLENWYTNYLETPNAKEVITLFDEMYPFAAIMTDVKKIDWALWSMGAG